MLKYINIGAGVGAVLLMSFGLSDWSHMVLGLLVAYDIYSLADIVY